MTSISRRWIRPLTWTFLLILAVATSAAAAEPAGEPASTPTAEAVTSAPVEGVVINWDFAAKRFTAPTADHAAELLRQFREQMAARFADGKGILAGSEKDVDMVILPNGMRRARLTVENLSTSVVRVEDGRFVEACVDGPAEAANVLTAPAQPATATVVWEEK